MPLVPKTYEQHIKSPKFYSTAVGDGGYNPEITMYYNNVDELLKIEEVWRGIKHIQTVSGSNYANHTIDYSVTYGAWEETTVS
jgi:hypothetical protein